MAGIKQKNYLIKRGDVWTADLRPGVGYEVAKKRPALVISNNAINMSSPITIILPISSQLTSALGPERIFLSADEINLEKDSVILTHQIRAIDKKRFGKKIGNISKAKMREVEESLGLVLDLEEEL